MARPTPKNPKGKQRKPKFTPEVIAKLEHAFSIDATVEEACYYADISQDTFYRWKKGSPQLSEKFDRLKNRPVFVARQSVVEGLVDPELALKYLERKRKGEFSKREEHTGADGQPLMELTEVVKEIIKRQ